MSLAAMVLAAIPVVVWSFDDGPNGFTPSGDSGQWEWGLPTTGPGGPTSVWATRLGADYFNDASDQLLVPLPDISGVADPVLTIRHWHRIQAGDYGSLEVNDGAGWVKVDPIFGYPSTDGFTGDSGGWIDTSLDLSPYSSSVQVRMRFVSDPAVSEVGWYLSEVGLYDGDVTAPLISPVSMPTDTEVVTVGYPVQVFVEDDTAVDTVTLYWAVNAGSEQSLAMVDTGSGIFEGVIPPQAPDSLVTWRAEASDGTLLSVYPDAGSESFRVFLPAPTDLRSTATGRVVDDRIELTWTPPVSIHAVQAYRIEAVDLPSDGPWVLFDTVGDVALTPDGARSFQVRAVFDVGVGEPSDPVTISAEVPELLAVWPPAAWPGDAVRVRVAGANLFLTQDTVMAGFGEGVRVDDIEVVDVDHATVLVAIDPEAVPGPRDLVLGGAYGSFDFVGRFDVLDGDDAPRILSIEPDHIEQGETRTVAITASQTFFGELVVDPGEGLLLVSDPVVDGDVARIELFASGDASPGPRTLVLDDGSRLWTADLVVEERRYTVQTGCGGCNAGSLPSRLMESGPVAWLLLLLGSRRRR